jgi:hypothetical protein
MTDRPRRSALYMPASNAKAIEKARTLACDVVILDLEDAVAPEAKETAREQAVQAIRDAGVSLWVADLDDRGVPPDEVPVDRPICLWMGAELEGVSPVAREAADGIVTLPMHGFAQSLNVSVAAALCLRPLAEHARTLGDRALLPAPEREAIWAAWMAREEAARAGLAARASLDLVEEAGGPA